MQKNNVIPEDVIGDWLRALDTTSDDTRRSYRNGLKALERYIIDNGLDLDKLEEEDLRQFKQDLLTRLSPGTVSTYLIAVRSFYRWAGNPAFPDIASRIKGASSGRNFKKDVLTPEQARKLIEAADGPDELGKRNAAILNLMLRTGLRDVEVVRADVGDITTEAGADVLYVHGKGRSEKDEFVVLTDKAVEAIRAYLAFRPDAEKSDPLFASLSKRNRGGRLTTRSVSGIVKKALRSIGLDDERHTAHSLRHTSVTYALMGGASLEETQKMARHANIETTMRYAHHVDRIKHAAELRIGSILDG